MRIILLTLLCPFLLGLTLTCASQKLKDPITKQVWVQLDAPENQPFYQRGQDLSSLVIAAMRSGEIKAYDSEGVIPMQAINCVLEFEVLVEEPEDPNDPFSPMIVKEVIETYYPEEVALLSMEYFEDARRPAKKQFEWVSFYVSAEFNYEGYDEYLFSVKYEDVVQALKTSEALWYPLGYGCYWQNGILASHKNYLSQDLAYLLFDLDPPFEGTPNDVVLEVGVSHEQTADGLLAKSISFYPIRYEEREAKKYSELAWSDLPKASGDIMTLAQAFVERKLRGEPTDVEVSWPIETKYAKRKQKFAFSEVTQIQQRVNLRLIMTEEDQKAIGSVLSHLWKNVSQGQLTLYTSDTLDNIMLMEEFKERTSYYSDLPDDPFSTNGTDGRIEIDDPNLIALHAIYDVTFNRQGLDKRFQLVGLELHMYPEYSPVMIYDYLGSLDIDSLNKLSASNEDFKNFMESLRIPPKNTRIYDVWHFGPH